MKEGGREPKGPGKSLLLLGSSQSTCWTHTKAPKGKNLEYLSQKEAIVYKGIGQQRWEVSAGSANPFECLHPQCLCATGQILSETISSSTNDSVPSM